MHVVIIFGCCWFCWLDNSHTISQGRLNFEVDLDYTISYNMWKLTWHPWTNYMDRWIKINSVTCIVHTNIDLKLQDKFHGPKHDKIGVTCVFNGHCVLYSVITRQSYPPISQFSRPGNLFKSVKSMFPCYTQLVINITWDHNHVAVKRN